ncbi:5,10-methylene-tetrahydrofolate dehydrogenase [Saccharopolyspora sp. NPDC002578]
MTAGDEQTETREGHGDRVLGLVTDPDMPTEIGSRLAQRITDWLGERTGEAWTVEVVSDPVTAGEADSEEILQAVQAYLSERDWSYAICLTDLPLLLEQSPLLADASSQRKVALVSLPALGGLQPYRRVRQVITQLLNDLISGNDGSGQASSDHHMASWWTDKLAPIRRSSPPTENIDVRYQASRIRGWIRLVSGMVRANRPWQLIWGLSSALAAALAAAGFGLFTSTVWQVGDVLGPLRSIGATVFSLGLMTVWLIASHKLWERVGRRADRDRRLAVLYNASTVTTLVIGVACLYLVVYVTNLIAAVFILDSSVVASMLGHATGWTTYAQLAWMVSSMALIAGALGSSLESDAAVRQAAYGYREEQRRAREATEDDRR